MNKELYKVVVEYPNSAGGIDYAILEIQASVEEMLQIMNYVFFSCNSLSDLKNYLQRKGTEYKLEESAICFVIGN